MKKYVTPVVAVAGVLITATSIVIKKKFGYDKDGYNSSGFDKNGYDRERYDENGYNQSGFDKNGYDKEGYDERGYNQSGFDKNGYDREGYDESGYDQSGFDKNGLDEYGCDKTGYDKNGYNKYGFDKYGFDKAGYDQRGNGRDYYTCEYDKILSFMKKAKNQMKQGEFGYASHDIRIGLEIGVKCVIAHFNRDYDLEQTLDKNISYCKYHELFDEDFIEQLYDAKNHCNPLQHDNDEEKNYGQLHFSYKTLERLSEYVFPLTAIIQ